MTSRALLPSALLTLALALSACGGSDDPESAGTPGPTPTTSAPPAEPTTAPTPSPTATVTKKPKPTATPTSDQNGDGDGIDDDRPATAGGGVCGDLDAGAVSTAAGAKLTGAALGGGPGCGFTTADRRSLEVTVVDRAAGAAGGMAGAMAEATSTVEGSPQQVTGVGSGAFVVTGTVFGGAETQGAGAVQVGDRIVNLTFTQHQKLTAAQVKARVIALLRLVADELD